MGSVLKLLIHKVTRFINRDTICSLQIFEDEGHPNFHMQGKGGRGKEGLSLFGETATNIEASRSSCSRFFSLGILNSTKTKMGYSMFKQWFLRPSLSLPLLQQRHNAIACFLRPQNTHLATAIGKSLVRTKNIPKVLVALKKGKAQAYDWSSLLQVYYNLFMGS